MQKVHIVNGRAFSSFNKAIGEISRLTGKPKPTKKLTVERKGVMGAMFGIANYTIDGRPVTQEEYKKAAQAECYPYSVEATEFGYLTHFENDLKIETLNVL